MPPSARPFVRRRSRSRPAGGAGGEHERVAEQAADRVRRAAGDGGGDEAVGGALEQRDLGAAPCERSASGSWSRQSSSTSEPRRRSRMPALRRRRKRANGRVSGTTCSAALIAWTACSSGAPECGVPSETVWRTSASSRRRGGRRCARPGRPSSARSARSARPRPASRATDLVEQRRQRRAVLGDVPAGVEADEDRRDPEVLVQPRRRSSASPTRTRSRRGRAGRPRAAAWRARRRGARPSGSPAGCLASSLSPSSPLSAASAIAPRGVSDSELALRASRPTGTSARSARSPALTPA